MMKKVNFFLFLCFTLQSCCNCKDAVMELFRYQEVKMEGLTSSNEPEGARFTVYFERIFFPPAAVSAAGMLGMSPCDCQVYGLESPLVYIRFIQTDTTGLALKDISGRFEGWNGRGKSGPEPKSLSTLAAEFQTSFSNRDDFANKLVFFDKGRDSRAPVLFYIKFEFANGQVLKTDTFASL